MDWIDIRTRPDEFIEAILNITKGGLSQVPGFDSLGPVVVDMRNEGRLKPEQAQKALDHLKSLKAKK